MCGICGFTGPEDKQKLKGMAGLLSHRGPDATGYFSDRHASLASKRLSIIDLSEKGKQPIHNENNDVWVVFNGEIYNFRTLKESLSKKHRFYSDTDTEVIVHLYEEFGEEFPKYLDGDFAIALWDAHKKILLLVRDRIGVKPLYFSVFNRNIVFASEQKCILLYDTSLKEIDNIALDQFFTFQRVIAPRTIFKRIKKVLPGQIIKYSASDRFLKSRKYYDINIGAPVSGNLDYITSKVEELLSSSVSKRLHADVPVGLYLSGGLDSTYIASLIPEEFKKDVKAYTVVFSEESEGSYASKVADKFGLEHIEIYHDSFEEDILSRITWHLDEPAVNIAALPTYIIAKETKKSMTVALTGDGGDELFGGYDRYRFITAASAFASYPQIAKKAAIGTISKFIDPRWAARLKEIEKQHGRDSISLAYTSTFSSQEKLLLYSRPFFELFQKNPPSKIFSAYIDRKIFSPIARSMFFDIKSLLPDDYLMKVDKMTMANSVEARVPYLDHKLVEFALRIPPSRKLGFFTTKKIVRKALSAKIGPSIWKRKKHGFNVPTARWMKGRLKEIAQKTLDDKHIPKKYLNSSMVKKVVRDFEKSPRYYSRQFWSLFSFQVWYEMYNDLDENKIKKYESHFMRGH